MSDEKVPFGLQFAKEPKIVSAELMRATSEWLTDPFKKEWDYDED